MVYMINVSANLSFYLSKLFLMFLLYVFSYTSFILEYNFYIYRCIYFVAFLSFYISVFPVNMHIHSCIMFELNEAFFAQHGNNNLH